MFGAESMLSCSIDQLRSKKMGMEASIKSFENYVLDLDLSKTQLNNEKLALKKRSEELSKLLQYLEQNKRKRSFLGSIEGVFNNISNILEGQFNMNQYNVPVKREDFLTNPAFCPPNAEFRQKKSIFDGSAKNPNIQLKESRDSVSLKSDLSDVKDKIKAKCIPELVINDNDDTNAVLTQYASSSTLDEEDNEPSQSVSNMKSSFFLLLDSKLGTLGNVEEGYGYLNISDPFVSQTLPSMDTYNFQMQTKTPKFSLPSVDEVRFKNL